MERHCDGFKTCKYRRLQLGKQVWLVVLIGTSLELMLWEAYNFSSKVETKQAFLRMVFLAM